MSTTHLDDHSWPQLDTDGGAQVMGSVHTDGGDFVGRDKITIYQSLTSSRLDYRSDIADILTFYTQTFVGREKEWAEITRLAGQKTPGYRLIEAPAGYGKSALLAQVIHRHENGQWTGSPPPHLLYFFIRQEGQRHIPEAFLQALNSQLLTLLKLPGGVPPDLTSLRGQFSELWSQALKLASLEQPLLWLVDGLDEQALGEVTIAQLLPVHLVDYVHIVVTSRPNPEPLLQTSLEHPFRQANILNLQTFGEAEIRALLQEFGATAVATDLAPRVLTLTQGEPLFARFICQAVTQTGETALARLEQQPPVDVETYFRQQFKQLDTLAQGDLTWQILGLLTVTLGGITVEEIAEVLEFDRRPIRKAIEPIQRFLLGQTRLELMHMQLRKVMQAEFSPKECRQFEEKLITWGHHYQQQGWPAETPDYLLAHYIQHLTTTGHQETSFDLTKIKQLLDLVKDTKWQIIRRQDDPTGLGLAQDVGLVCKVAARGGIPTLIQYVAASFLRAKLKSLITNLPPGIVEAMAWLGQFDQAVILADMMAIDSQRITAWQRLAKWCLEQGKANEAISLLDRVLTGFLTLEQVVNRPNHLVRLANLFSMADQLEKAEQTLASAFELVNTFEDETKRSEALIALVRGMFDYNGPLLEKWLNRAEEVARQFEEIHFYQALVLARIAEQYQRVNLDHAHILVREALAILTSAYPDYGDEDITENAPSSKDSFLAVTIGIAAQMGLQNEAVAWLPTIEDIKQQAIAHAELGGMYAQEKSLEKARYYLQQAFLIAEAELKENDLDSFKFQLVNLFLQVPDLSQAQQIAITIQEPLNRINAFGIVAEQLCQSREFEAAQAWLDQMKVDWGQGYALSIIAKALISTDPRVAYAKLEDALRQAQQIEEGVVGIKYDIYTFIVEQIVALAKVEPQLAKNLLEQVISHLQSTVTRDALELTALSMAKSEALENLISLLAFAGYYAEGADIAHKIRYGSYKDYALLLCLRAACRSNDWETANQLLSEMGDKCLKLTGTVTMTGWQTGEDQSLESFLLTLEDEVAEACHHPTRQFINQLGDAAIELGNSGHLPAAQILWARMTDALARQESQAELVGLLAQANRIELAEQLTNEIKPGKFKAKALALVARCYAHYNLSKAQTLVERAWQEVPRHNTSMKAFKHWYYDDVFIVLAGTMASWNLREADQIPEQYMYQEVNYLRARGEVNSTIAAIDPQEAYTRLIKTFATGADEGITGFWQSLMVNMEALGKLIGIPNLIEIHEHIVSIEGDARS